MATDESQQQPSGAPPEPSSRPPLVPPVMRPSGVSAGNPLISQPAVLGSQGSSGRSPLPASGGQSRRRQALEGAASSSPTAAAGGETQSAAQANGSSSRPQQPPRFGGPKNRLGIGRDAAEGGRTRSTITYGGAVDKEVRVGFSDIWHKQQYYNLEKYCLPTSPIPNHHQEVLAVQRVDQFTIQEFYAAGVGLCDVYFCA